MGVPFPIVNLPNQNPKLLNWDIFLSFTLFYVKENQVCKILYVSFLTEG